jgi:hypothetical protein
LKARRCTRRSHADRRARQRAGGRLAFSLDAAAVQDELADLESDPEEFHRALALSLRDQQARNEPSARRLRRAFNLALGALAPQRYRSALAGRYVPRSASNKRTPST